MTRLSINSLPRLPRESYKAIDRLRTGIEFGSDAHSIVVTSAANGEGKTFISMYLWKLFSEVGKRVLLIDCDLHGSVLLDRYNITSDGEICGLSSYLSGKNNENDIICSTNFTGGYIIPVGAVTGNPRRLLENGRLTKLIERTKYHFDYVIIDTPSLDEYTDSVYLNSICDGALLVIRSGIATNEVLKNAARMLSSSGGKLLGSVLNDVNYIGKDKNKKSKNRKKLR